MVLRVHEVRYIVVEFREKNHTTSIVYKDVKWIFPMEKRSRQNRLGFHGQRELLDVIVYGQRHLSWLIQTLVVGESSYYYYL
jgi:hypothetical protein